MAPETRSRRTWSVDDDVADAVEARERLGRDRAGEAQLHLVVGEVAQALDAVHLDELAVADDRDAIAGPLDLGQDVAREEDRPALGLRLADEGVERLLDERIQARGRLVEDQQLRPVLERDDEADLLLVALRVLLELARRVDLEALDERRLVGRVDAAAQVGEVAQRLAAGQAVVQRELARDVADAPMDRDRVDGRLDAEHEGPAAGRPDEVEDRPDRGRLAGAVRARGIRRPRPRRRGGRRRRCRGACRRSW